MIDGKILMDVEAEAAIKANMDGDQTLSAKVTALSAKVPNATLPTSGGAYELNVDASGEAPVYSWAAAGTELPTQTGNSGKLLTTNGTAVSWTEIAASMLGTGYDAAKTQTLKNVEGVLTWVEDQA